MARRWSALATMAADRTLRRAATALALYRLAGVGPWVAMLVYAYSQGAKADAEDHPVPVPEAAACGARDRDRTPEGARNEAAETDNGVASPRAGCA